MSPLASISAALHFIIGMPVRSRSFMTSVALMSAMVLSFRDKIVGLNLFYSPASQVNAPDGRGGRQHSEDTPRRADAPRLSAGARLILVNDAAGRSRVHARCRRLRRRRDFDTAGAGPRPGG